MRILGIVLAVLALLVAGAYGYFSLVANPRVAREIEADPDGARARRVMLIDLPSGKRLPVNYLREGEWVYAGADGRWWRELAAPGARVSVFIRGKSYQGHATAVVDDPERTKDVFARLRPDALEGFGTLVAIRLDEGSAPAPAD